MNPTEKKLRFMTDKFGLPLNKAILAKSGKKFGALGQY